ncbi:disease resistance protein RUN1 [Trifolium repens]|nr:disease resistance protein RUN1 [Trifolium repens]
MAIQSPSSSSSLSNRFKYQVFISFRGQDTRYNVAGNLYNALTKMGIHTFFDEYDLEGGDEITPSLFEAIEDSTILIPVFSVHYASSSFCLKELAHIMKCYNTNNRLVIPIFFDVDPTHVRHQTRTYGEDLAENEEMFQGNEENMEQLQQWKVALKDAANLTGEHFRSWYPTLLTTRISVICGGQKRPQKLKKQPEQRICGGFDSHRITAGWKLLRRFFGS